MTGWSMLNIEVTADDEKRRQFSDLHGTHLDEGIQKKAHKEGHPSQGYVSSARYHGSVVIRISGYREWSEDLRFLRSLYPSFWDRCVIVHSNDTADIGTARLYEWDKDELEQVDEYAESQTDDGCMVGDKAAAAMFAVYGIPTLGNFQHPYEFTKQTGEWDDEKMLADGGTDPYTTEGER